MSFRLLQLAQGLDATPVLPFRKVPRLCVAHTLERDEIDRERLEAILFQQVEDAGWMLRCHNRYPGQLVLEIRYADGVTVRNQHPLSPITSQVDQRLFRVARSAFDRLVQRRIAIRRLVLELSDFAMPFRQLSLFPWEEATFDDDQKIQRASMPFVIALAARLSLGENRGNFGCRISDCRILRAGMLTTWCLSKNRIFYHEEHEMISSCVFAVLRVTSWMKRWSK